MAVHTPLSDLMTTSVITVCASEPLIKACEIMSHDNISCVVVVDGENPSKPIGIVTERRIVRFIAEHPADRLSSCYIAEIISGPLHTLRCNHSAYDAIRLYQKESIRHIVVVDANGDLAGIVSFTDIVEQVMAETNRNKSMIDEESNSADSINEVMRRLAFTDPMTGISNRRAMDLDLDHQWEISKRYGRVFSLAMLDVDFFKPYNDHYGHLAGDEILIKVANVIEDSTRASDRLFRFGGEEFCLMLPETCGKDATMLVGRIIKAIEKLAISHEKSPYGVLTVSGGVAELNADEPACKKDLLQNADRALYQAKTTGRNRAVYHQLLEKIA